MSWFTEIAGKAENLLNKVDQTAATALQNKSKSTTSDSINHYSSTSDIYEPNYSTGIAYSPARRITPSTPPRSNSIGRKKAYSPGVLTPKKKPESDDEKLMEFLNCDEALPVPENKTNEEVIKKNSSSEVPLIENIVRDNNGEEQAPFQEKPTVDLVESVSSISSDAPTNNAIKEIPPFNDTELSTDIDVPCKIEDTSANNQDLLKAQKRVQYAESEMKRMSMKLDHWNSQISGNDKAVRELRDRERDLVAAIDAKDSQLAVLKVRLQEADQELHTKKNILQELKAENDRLIKEHAESASSQNSALEILRDQLQHAEMELKKAKESLQHSQNEHMQQMSKMEEEHRHLVDSYSALQRKWNDVNERNKEIASQLKSANGNFDTLQQEYNDYKQKAQRILQSKEKLISSLKEGSFDVESIERNEASSAILNAEVEGVKQERDLLREELRRANELIETYRSEIQELEKISQNDLASAQQTNRLLKEQFEMEKTLKEELQLMNVQFKEEVLMLRDDLTRTKSTFQSRLQEREIEIEKLRRQLTAKSLSTVSQDELESRLHALTENLIQKQTVVEALSTEKNSLVLQLERLEQQLREAQNYGVQQHTYVGINNNESDRKSKAVFLENPFDSALTRRVKRVYGSIDSLSIRLGVFFRRYPITRVFVFIYMMLLHFWVMIVLLTYEPEIHNSSYDIVKK